MAKSKAPKHIQDRRKQPRRKKTKPTDRWWKLPLAVLGALSAVVGFVAAILTFLPKLSLDVSGSLRPHDPMGTVFYLSNDGVVAVHEVHVECRLVNLGLVNRTVILGPTFRFPGSDAPTLPPGHKLTTPCARAVQVGYPGARMARLDVLATYKPPLVWWHRTDIFPLKAEKSDDGTWIWDHISN
jgi:hypothetical protein